MNVGKNYFPEEKAMTLEEMAKLICTRTKLWGMCLYAANINSELLNEIRDAISDYAHDSIKSDGAYMMLGQKQHLQKIKKGINTDFTEGLLIHVISPTGKEWKWQH